MQKSKLVLFVFILLTCLLSCQKDNSPITYTPVWLNSYIEDIEQNPTYRNAVITRYEWKSNFYYDVMVPTRSCYPCEVFNQSGQLVQWNSSSSIDFVNNRKNPYVIWRWKNIS
jgi:hypothetical protein